MEYSLIPTPFNRQQLTGAFMEREIKATCPYLKESSEGGVCRLMDCRVREIRFTNTGLCLGEHAICRIYRRYNDDYIES